MEITVLHYDKAFFEDTKIITLEECKQYSLREGVSWIDIDSIKDANSIKLFAESFNFHPLMIDNILDHIQRPKFEDFDNQVYLFFKLLTLKEEDNILETENISLIFNKNVVITFQGDIEGDVFNEVRQKIKIQKCKMRKSNADILVYELLHATIESYFKIAEQLGEKIEVLETTLISNPESSVLRRIYRLRRSMMFLRKTIWPMREVLNNIIRTDSEWVQDSSKVYFRDVYDHCTQLLEHIEIHREMLAGLLDIYLSSISYRMNAVMKVLTIISTIFIPLTFITSIYGMNFEIMPELKWKYGYGLVWVIVVVVTTVMLYYFKKKKWF